MIDFRFNKRNTSLLLKASAQIPDRKMSRLRLDWLLDKSGLVGCIYDRWPFAKVVCHVVRDNRTNKYKLASMFRNSPRVYLIEDIDAFLDFINIDELCTPDEEVTQRIYNNINDLDYTGLVKINDDKIFLYDKYFTVEEENE